MRGGPIPSYTRAYTLDVFVEVTVFDGGAMYEVEIPNEWLDLHDRTETIKRITEGKA